MLSPKTTPLVEFESLITLLQSVDIVTIAFTMVAVTQCVEANSDGLIVFSSIARFNHLCTEMHILL